MVFVAIKQIERFGKCPALACREAARDKRLQELVREIEVLIAPHRLFVIGGSKLQEFLF